jgi:cellulose synthase/poly-beta-1,6-N-acetylglucosamine synthase-like glycosyltransferase
MIVLPLYIYLGLQVILASWLIQPFFLLLIHAIGKMIGIRPVRTSNGTEAKDYSFAVLITAHQQTEFLPPIVDSLLKQTYTRFNVYIVADDCDISQVHFTDPRIRILVPPAPLHDQVASLQYGLRHLADRDEVLVIFDPDNLVHPDFLRTMNAWYNKGYQAVQGSLQAKNKEGVYAKLDSLGVLMGNFLERDIRSMLGLSVTIWGCGVSVKKEVFQKIIFDSKSRMGGFDKHMQAEIASNVDRIGYAREAIVYDEKVDDGHNFERQRIRWIAAYFKFLGKAFRLLLTGIRKGDFNLMYFGYNLIRLPWFLLLLLAGGIAATDWFIYPVLTHVWLVVLCLFLLSFVTIVAIQAEGRSISQALLFIPLVFYHQLRALFRIRVSSRSLLKTDHSKILYIDDILHPSAGEVTSSPLQTVIASSAIRPPAPASN